MKPEKITSLWAWVATEPLDGDEGVMGFNSPAGWVPAIGADRERVEALRGFAQDVADLGVVVKLMRFADGAVLETLETHQPAERETVDG